MSASCLENATPFAGRIQLMSNRLLGVVVRDPLQGILFKPSSSGNQLVYPRSTFLGYPVYIHELLFIYLFFKVAEAHNEEQFDGRGY